MKSMTLQNETKLLLAGEGGGSKTALCLLGQTGTVMARTETEGVAAIKTGLRPVKDIIREGISKLRDDVGLSNAEISSCYFSLGGPNQSEVECALQSCLPSTKVFVGREADGDLIINCAPHFNCSAAVMAGTGSVAVGEFAGKRYFAGGWGYEFDDAGSGGRIGKDALAAFLCMLDRRRVESPLCKIFAPLLRGLDLETFSGRMNLKRKIHALDRKQLASHAPVIYACFKRGDATAAEIITRAAKDIAALAAAIVPEETGLDYIGILCLGGMFKLGQGFRDLCSSKLKELRPECELVFRDDFDLAKGACLMALKLSGIKINQEIVKLVLEQ